MISKIPLVITCYHSPKGGILFAEMRQDTAFDFAARGETMIKTERLTIKILSSDKAKIERIAQSEGEPVAVIVRRIIRNATQEYERTTPTADAIKAQQVGVIQNAIAG